jgi:hypothetical protein
MASSSFASAFRFAPMATGITSRGFIWEEPPAIDGHHRLSSRREGPASEF